MKFRSIALAAAVALAPALALAQQAPAKPAAPAAKAAATSAAPAMAAATGKEQFFPALVYRTGAYAPNGVPFANGYVDYFKLVNAKGGINGVKLIWEECETGYATDRGVECYERLKGKHGGATVFQPLSTGITFALTEKAPGERSLSSPPATAAAKAPTATSSSGTSRSPAPTGTRPTSCCSTSPRRKAAGTS